MESKWESSVVGFFAVALLVQYVFGLSAVSDPLLSLPALLFTVPSSMVNAVAGRMPLFVPAALLVMPLAIMPFYKKNLGIAAYAIIFGAMIAITVS